MAPSSTTVAARAALETAVAHPSVHNTLGAVFVGLIVASILFGITTLQAYLYFHNFTKDTRLHKISVAILWILETVHLGCIVHTSYHYGITGFGDYTMDGQIIAWSVKLSALLNVCIILGVHCLYAFRVWLLGGYHQGLLGYFVAGVVFGGFVIGVVLVYMIYSIESFSQLGGITWAVVSSLVTSTTIDFVIAAAMCYYLRKSKGQMTKLNSRISALMQYILGSGLLTSACSLSIVFTFTLMPNSLVFLAIQGLSTQLYVGSFLCMLNARTPAEQESDKSQRSHQRSLPSLNVNIQTAHSFGSSAPTSSLSETKHRAWEIESQTETLRLPTSAYTSPRQSPQKPEYARQW